MTMKDHQPEVTATNDEMAQIHELTSVVEDLISMMAAGNIGSLKIEYGSLRLALQSNDRVAKSSRMSENGSLPVAPVPIAAEGDAPAVGHTVTAPMIGTFYAAPAPNEPPFITVGDTVVEGQTIGIIEAMKIMNEIASNRSGTVLEIVASDGQTVEYGSPLIRLEPSGE